MLYAIDYTLTDSLVTLIAVEFTPGPLGNSVFCASVTATAHVKLVSTVLRGERVRVEEFVEEEIVMMVRPPDTIVLLSRSRQVKVKSRVPLSTALFNIAEQLRIVSTIPPATTGELGAIETATMGEETIERQVKRMTSCEFKHKDWLTLNPEVLQDAGLQWSTWLS